MTTDTQPRHGAAILRTALRRNLGAMAWGTLLMGLYQAGDGALWTPLERLEEAGLPSVMMKIVRHVLKAV